MLTSDRFVDIVDVGGDEEGHTAASHPWTGRIDGLCWPYLGLSVMYFLIRLVCLYCDRDVFLPITEK